MTHALVQGLGFFTNEFGNEVLVVTNPDHVTEILSTCITRLHIAPHTCVACVCALTHAH